MKIAIVGSRSIKIDDFGIYISNDDEIVSGGAAGIAEESRTHTVLCGKYPHLLQIKHSQYLILLRIFSLHLHNICSLKTA